MYTAHRLCVERDAAEAQVACDGMAKVEEVAGGGAWTRIRRDVPLEPG